MVLGNRYEVCKQQCLLQNPKVQVVNPDTLLLFRALSAAPTLSLAYSIRAKSPTALALNDTYQGCPWQNSEEHKTYSLGPTALVQFLRGQ